MQRRIAGKEHGRAGDEFLLGHTRILLRLRFLLRYRHVSGRLHERRELRVGDLVFVHLERRDRDLVRRPFVFRTVVPAHREGAARNAQHHRTLGALLEFALDILRGRSGECEEKRADDERRHAVAVRSDLKGQGIGWSMLDNACDYARSRGFKALHSVQLSDDRAAIALDDARARLARLESLQASNAVTTVQVNEAELAVRNAELALRDAELALERRSILSPIDGVVLRDRRMLASDRVVLVALTVEALDAELRHPLRVESAEGLEHQRRVAVAALDPGGLRRRSGDRQRDETIEASQGRFHAGDDRRSALRTKPDRRYRSKSCSPPSLGWKSACPRRRTAAGAAPPLPRGRRDRSAPAADTPTGRSGSTRTARSRATA